MSEQKPREIAARLLAERPAGEFVEDRFDRRMAEARLSGPDRRLCQELVYGVIRWQATLDCLIARKTDGRPQSPRLQNLLRLGLYQIFWLDRIPDHAAVHETVELAKQSGFGAQAGFVNALLRGYVRESEPTRQLLAELKQKDPPLGYSHPAWLVQRWQARWGSEAVARLMAWNNSPPRTFARVNLLKTDPGKLLAQWRDEDVEYDFIRRGWFEENLVFELKSFPPLARLPSFQSGGFYVQDPSTLLAVHVLDPQPGEKVIDLCAAPGGKLTYIGQLMRNEGRLVARDSSPERLALVAENCARLGVTNVECRVAAETAGPDTLAANRQALRTMPHGFPDLYDRVLVDAPCSNTGVMRRRVDLRWRLRPEEITRLSAVQQGLLRQASDLVKPGGVLVYSTCSLEPEENQAVVKEYLGGEARFRMESERDLRPFLDPVDGAYVARLVRTAA